jgi:hypothetical protein
MSWTLRWLLAFALTQSVEMGIYAQAHEAPRPLRERLAIAFACSGITHPLVWFVIPELMDMLSTGWASGPGWLSNWWTTVAVAEAFAVLAETALLAAFAVRWALAWALLANATSFTVGLFLYTYFPDW